ncbi:hypothetical protein H072_3788 [Dactylellina haptotyla CBS 200.50]|uniref:Uncharacterized protein n=1 Tax=Dactylellina haptotyla (strain CBS 200.50) TaxID=1284197 RepID=S8AGQ7_DACHA|nr:hypothetical protein H072_3788 [Dactylellina haptotyla CBS 200.50]
MPKTKQTLSQPTMPVPTSPAELRRLKNTSYLLSYLQKSEHFSRATGTDADVPNFFAVPKDVRLHVNLSTGSSNRSSLSDDGEREYRFESEEYNAHIREGYSNVNAVIREDNQEDLEVEGEEEEWEQDWEDTFDNDEEGSDDESDIDPDELTNLPYKSPAVYQLPGSGNGNRFRTLVRDGPVGCVQGENQRFVVIGKRSFRGAGLWPGELVQVDVEMGGVLEEDETMEEDDGSEEDGTALEGEVEVMWSDDGEEFWLVRDPAEDGGIGKETSWVSKEWFVTRQKALVMSGSKTQVKGGNQERVELRVAMEED